MRRPWSPTLTATDASPTGYGVCERHISAQQSQSLGEWSERWRFKPPPSAPLDPRERTVGRDVFADPLTSKGGWVRLTKLICMWTMMIFLKCHSIFVSPDWKTVKNGKVEGYTGAHHYKGG